MKMDEEKVLKRLPMLFDTEERKLLGEVAEGEGLSELSNVIRLLIHEGMERRGKTMSETAFRKKQEGRPKRPVAQPRARTTSTMTCYVTRHNYLR